MDEAVAPIHGRVVQSGACGMAALVLHQYRVVPFRVATDVPQPVSFRVAPRAPPLFRIVSEESPRAVSFRVTLINRVRRQ
jgi:hypothetical protein